MSEKNKKIAMRVMAVLPYLMGMYLLQGVVLSRLKPLGVTPLILPAAVCGAALFSGRVYGCVFGVLAGMLCDMSFNEPTVIFTLALAFIGLAVGALAETVLQEGVISFAVTSLAALVICAFIQTARLIFIESAALADILSVALRQTFTSMLFSIPLYFISKAIGRME